MRSAFAWRLALTAQRWSNYVLRGAFIRVLVGLALGLPLAIGAGRLISSQLYGVSFWDPLALMVAASCARDLRLCRGHDSSQPRRIHLADECTQNRIAYDPAEVLIQPWLALSVFRVKRGGSTITCYWGVAGC